MHDSLKVGIKLELVVNPEGSFGTAPNIGSVLATPVIERFKCINFRGEH